MGDFVPFLRLIPVLFPQDAQMTKTLDEYRSPKHKLIAMLKKGRENLREKYRELMKRVRVAENQVRAVEASREQWRVRAEAAEAVIKELKKSLN
jgi:hypothetical protein